MMVNSDWHDISNHARAHLDGKIPNDWRIEINSRPSGCRNVFPVFGSAKILSTRELEITSAEDATYILKHIHEGSWSAEEVTIAFCKRAAMAHQLVHCLMDADFTGAIQRARELDQYQRDKGAIVGPLHGLPVSLKDLTAAKGLKYSMGLVSWADKVSDFDALVTAALRKAGAIIYVKTTMPQTGMAIESVSNLWGRTLNPHNTLLTPGGSSGGEGALVACRGSPVGIGTDIGGSIRAPAAFSGVYGIKPTSKRGTYKGNMNNSTSFSPIWSAMGPIGHSVRDLELISQVLNEAQPWLTDSRVVNKAWRTVSAPSKVTIGVMWWDQVVQPHPPIQRALRELVGALRATGHEVVDFEPYKHDYGLTIAKRLYYPTGGKEIREALSVSGEPAIPAVERSLKNAKPLDIEDLMYFMRERERYQDEYLAHWKASSSRTSTGKAIDAILMPAHESASFPHDSPVYGGYLCQWNLLDYPAVILPVTKVDKAIDLSDPTYQPINDLDERNNRGYDPEVYDGAPVSLQLVGRPLAEEELLASAEAIDRVWRTHRESPPVKEDATAVPVHAKDANGLGEAINYRANTVDDLQNATLS